MGRSPNQMLDLCHGSQMQATTLVVVHTDIQHGGIPYHLVVGAGKGSQQESA